MADFRKLSKTLRHEWGFANGCRLDKPFRCLFISLPRGRDNQVAATIFFKTNFHHFRLINSAPLLEGGHDCWSINGEASTVAVVPFSSEECVLVEPVHFPINWSLQGWTSMLASSLFGSTFTGACGEGTAQPVFPPLDHEHSMAMSYAKDEARLRSCSDFWITGASMV